MAERTVQVLEVRCKDGIDRYTKTIAGPEMHVLVAFADKVYGIKTIQLRTIPERDYDALPEKNILRRIII